jgi:hypothetical protein
MMYLVDLDVNESDEDGTPVESMLGALVPIVYRKVDGMAALYWARSAKIIGVGPAGM